MITKEMLNISMAEITESYAYKTSKEMLLCKINMLHQVIEQLLPSEKDTSSDSSLFPEGKEEEVEEYWKDKYEQLEKELDEMRKELKEANEHIDEGIISEGELIKVINDFAKHLHESHVRYDRLSEKLNKPCQKCAFRERERLR